MVWRRGPAAVAVVVLLLAIGGCTGSDGDGRRVSADGAVLRTASDKHASDLRSSMHRLRPAFINLQMIGPRYGVTFDEVHLLDTLTGWQALALGLVDKADYEERITAGPGQQFLVAMTGKGEGTGEAHRPDPPPLTAHLSVGDRTHPLDVDDGGFFTGAGGALVATVARDADPVLSVTDLGDTQTLNLRTGIRGGHAPEAYYPLRSGKVDVFSPAQTRVGPAGHVYRVRLEVSAFLGAYSAEHGWAAPGHGWLTFTVGYSAVSDLGDSGNWAFTVDLGRTLTFAAPGLPPHPITATVTATHPVQAQGPNPTSPTVAATVDVADPDSVTIIAVTLGSGGVFTADGTHPRMSQLGEATPVRLPLRAA